MSNNIEKKLDALIDALGFDVEEVQGDVFLGCYSGRDVYNKQAVDYKITKRNQKQTHSELIISLAQSLYKHSITAGMKMHTLNYNGTTLKYSFESGLMEIVTNEEI